MTHVCHTIAFIVPGYGDVIGILSPALEVCLLWRLVRVEMRGRYPFLFAYITYCFLGMDLTLYVVRRALPNLYARLYWELEGVCLLLGFCVVLEIYRQTFARATFANQLRPGAGWLRGFWIALFALSWIGSYSSFRSIYLAMECSLGFAQAALVLAQLLAAKHLGLPMGRNAWGMAVGFGAYSSIDVLHFALFDMDRFLLPYIRVVVPMSFVAMLAVWTWALWNYAPNPSVAGERAGAENEDLIWWTGQWERASSEVRKVVNL